MDIYQKAIFAIRSHPYSFLYHPDFMEALDAVGIKEQDEILNMIR